MPTRLKETPGPASKLPASKAGGCCLDNFFDLHLALDAGGDAARDALFRATTTTTTTTQLAFVS